MASNRNRKDGISRRDFLNGMLLAAGGVAVGGFSPMRAFAAAPPIPAISSTATAYAVAPYNDFLNDIYDTTDIDWQNHLVADPFYSYFFDDQNPYALPGVHSWNLDTYGKGLKDTPYPTNIVQDLQMAKQDLRNWYVRHGSPTDPADNSDPRFDYLSPMTFSNYLTSVRGFHPA